MPYKVKTNKPRLSSFGNSQVDKIKSDITNIVDEKSFLFYEMEPVSVEKVYLDKDAL